jgi:hypothetical protein
MMLAPRRTQERGIVARSGCAWVVGNTNLQRGPCWTEGVSIGCNVVRRCDQLQTTTVRSGARTVDRAGRGRHASLVIVRTGPGPFKGTTLNRSELIEIVKSKVAAPLNLSEEGGGG